MVIEVYRVVLTITSGAEGEMFQETNQIMISYRTASVIFQGPKSYKELFE